MVFNWQKMVKSHWFFIMRRGVYSPFWHGDLHRIGAGVAETALVMFVMGHWYNHFLYIYIIMSFSLGMKSSCVRLVGFDGRS